MKKYDLQRWAKNGSKYTHTGTPITNQPYAICKGEKTKIEANELSHFEFLKIVENE